MRTMIMLGGLAVAAALAPRPQQQSCRVEIETAPGTVTHVTRLADGERRFDAGGGVEATCGEKWVRADSATWYENRGVLHLFENVRFRDSSRELDADRATYFRDEDRMRSEGNVRLVETESGSTLTGPVLDYFPANAVRPVERIFAPRRPHLTFYPGAGESEGGEPFDVDADRIHIYGDSALAGAGNVVAVRADLEATGDSLDLNLRLDRLWLLGDPRILMEGTSLAGDSILATLEAGEMREIEAWPNGRAEGESLSLTAPLLRLFMEEGEVVRTVAASGAPERTGVVDSAGRAPWAHSQSEDFTLIADSIDILRPGGRLDRVIAVWRARAASRNPVEPGDSLLGRDWISGDTVTGFFTATDSAAAPRDSAALERLVASGNARALSHLEEEGGEQSNGRTGINYVVGLTVIMWLGGGEVDSVRVIGPATGLYIKPESAATDTAAITVDSAAVEEGEAQADTSGTQPPPDTTASSVWPPRSSRPIPLGPRGEGSAGGAGSGCGR